MTQPPLMSLMECSSRSFISRTRLTDIADDTGPPHPSDSRTSQPWPRGYPWKSMNPMYNRVPSFDVLVIFMLKMIQY